MSSFTKTELAALASKRAAQDRFWEEFHSVLSAVAAEILPEAYRAPVASYLARFRGVHVQSVDGPDLTARPTLVFAQACVEEALARMKTDGRLTSFTCVIHTRTPATPLCTEGGITEGLVAAEIAADEVRSKTVSIRAGTVRRLLESGGTVVAAYPREGREKRTEEHLSVFRKLLAAHPANLVDVPLDCDRSAMAAVEGATYFFRPSACGESLLVYGGRGRQANDPASPTSASPAAEGVQWMGAAEEAEPGRVLACVELMEETSDWRLRV